MIHLNHNTNTLRFLSSLLLCLVVCSTAKAQQDSNENKSVVLYDPLLWKHELKLNAGQREKIEKINLEFYQSIYKTAKEGTSDRSTLQAKANQYLQQRSQDIWDSFNPNQRRKWKRMWDHYSS